MQHNDGQARRARWAVSAQFCTNGLIFAQLVPRYPEIKNALGLSNAAFGTAIAAHSVGALVAGLFSGWLVTRFSSARVAVTGTVAAALVLVGIGWAASWWTLALLVFAAGLLDGVIDIAENTHGLRVQRALGRSIITSLHGIWSVGAVGGGLLASAVVAAHIPMRQHLPVAAGLIIAAVLSTVPFLLPGSDRHDDEHHPHTRTRGATLLLLLGIGGVAIAGGALEDVGNTWGGLWIINALHKPTALAGTGFVAMMSAMTLGRFLGDPAVERWGARTVSRTGALLGMTGISLVIAVPRLSTTYVGFVLAGLGAAVLIPLAMHAADEVPGLPPGVGVAIVGSLTRIAFLTSPPLVGLIADTWTLRWGFLVAFTLAALGVVLASLVGTPPGLAGDRRPGTRLQDAT